LQILDMLPTAHALEPDALLMLGVKQDDERAMALLLDRHRRPVIHFLYRMVRDYAVAEDLAQNVFLRVYRARATYEPAAKFTSWLFQIATRVALNWIRDTRREAGRRSLSADPERDYELEIADQRPAAEQMLLRDARAAEIRRAIASLPARQRAAVLMHKYEELEYAQIAAALQCSPQSVKSLLFRAYTNLRARLSHLA
jgi:RNA polymerase sigma-70 factor (ECF subfamily)